MNENNTLLDEDIYLDDTNNDIGFEQDITKKMVFLSSLVIWIVGGMLIIPISVPGIIISVQFLSDECVKNSSNINIALDAWLGIASGCMILIIVVLLVLVCVSAPGSVFKGILGKKNLRYFNQDGMKY